MTGIVEPELTFTIIPAAQLAAVQDQKVLIPGQKLAAGTAVAGQLYTDLTDNTNEINTLFGRRSHIAGIIRAYKQENEITRMDVIPLDDASGTAGTAVLTFGTGPAGADGTYVISVCSAEDYQVTIDVLETDSITEIGDAVVAAYDLLLDAPFTSANVAGVVTFTAENDGTLCNDWDIRIEGVVDSVTVAVTGWSGGATDPSLTGVLDVIGNIRYQTILWPSNYILDEVQTLLDARFNSVNAIQDGIALQVKKGTLASLVTYTDQNSQSIVITGNKTLAESDRIGTMIPEMPDILAAQITAIRGLRLTQDAQLSDYLSSVATKDQFGGISLASLPYFNTGLPNAPIPKEQDSWEIGEMEDLKDGGIAVIGGNRAFSGVILGEFVTSYLTNTSGNPDTSYKFLNTVDTASVIREFYYENSRSKYAQTRLTNGDLVAGRDMANAGSIRAFFNELYDELADEVIVQKGTVAKQDFNDNLSITTDIATGTATFAMAPLLVSQLRAIIGTFQINFGG